MKYRLSIIVLGVVFVATTSQLFANNWFCSVPVFRYALERWKPDNYEVVVFYRASSGELDRKLIDDLTPEGLVGKSHTNLSLNLVDVDTESDIELQKLWEQQENTQLPRMVLRYPKAIAPVWSGPFNRENVMLAIDSPLRQQIARKILSGETSVWVFLESGNVEADNKAYRTLVDGLKQEEKNLKLPEISQEDIDAGLVRPDALALRISFPVVKLSRKDSREKMFVEMLLGSEGSGKHSLRDPEFAGKPMAFPIFGRGRVLYGLIGDGIMQETIHTACAWMTGPCSCQIKDENPGMDLVIAADWEKFIDPQFKDKPLPELQGLGQFQEVPLEGTLEKKSPTDRKGLGNKDVSTDAKPVSSNGNGDETTNSKYNNESSPDDSVVANASAENDESDSNSLMRNTLVLFGACAIGVFGFTFFLISRRS